MTRSAKNRTREAALDVRRPSMKTAVTSAVLVASIATALGAGSAAAVEQGGTNPNDSVPQQGGTAPTDTAPQQGGTAPTPAPEPSAPINVPGAGSIPAPPQEAPYQPYTAAPQYEESGYTDPGYSTYYSPGTRRAAPGAEARCAGASDCAAAQQDSRRKLRDRHTRRHVGQGCQLHQRVVGLR